MASGRTVPSFNHTKETTSRPLNAEEQKTKKNEKFNPVLIWPRSWIIYIIHHNSKSCIDDSARPTGCSSAFGAFYNLFKMCGHYVLKLVAKMQCTLYASCVRTLTRTYLIYKCILDSRVKTFFVENYLGIVCVSDTQPCINYARYWFGSSSWLLVHTETLSSQKSRRTSLWCAHSIPHSQVDISVVFASSLYTHISYIHYYVCCIHFGIQVLCYACVLCSNYLHCIIILHTRMFIRLHLIIREKTL